MPTVNDILFAAFVAIRRAKRAFTRGRHADGRKRLRNAERLISVAAAEAETGLPRLARWYTARGSLN